MYIVLFSIELDVWLVWMLLLNINYFNLNLNSRTLEGDVLNTFMLLEITVVLLEGSWIWLCTK